MPGIKNYLRMLGLASMVACSTEGQREPGASRFSFRPLPLEVRERLAVSDEEWSRLAVRYPLDLEARLVRRRRGVPVPIQSKELPLNENASADAKRCWDVFLSGGYDCHAEVPPPSPSADRIGEVDLLVYARELSRALGLLRASEVLSEKMGELDAHGGELETLLQRSARDPEFRTPSSVVHLKPQERARIGVFVVFGIDVTGDSPNRALIRRAAQAAKDLGFAAHLLETEPAADYESNARLISTQVRAKIGELDKVIVVAASKGVADTLTFMLNDSPLLSAQDRERFRLLVALSGVVRESFVAHWMSYEKAPFPFVLRKGIPIVNEGDPMEGIRALARSPWGPHDPSELKRAYPRLRWISFSMLPARPETLPPAKKLDVAMLKYAYRQNDWASPSDGLMETAATILPPGTGISMDIVRGHGPHALAVGRYLNGEPIAPKYRTAGPGGTMHPEAGAEILDSFLRVLDQKYLD